jgi:hypothetical protein
MSKLQSCVLLLCAAIFSGFAMAEDYVRDGRPCLSGICVGDEITALSKIKWQPASYHGKPITSMTLRIKDVENNVVKHFSPNAAEAARDAALYLGTDSFDGKAIPKLVRIKGFCERMISRGMFANDDGMGMLGIFTSESGHKTSVSINVVPGIDPASQSLRVIEIKRLFPREYTQEQMTELTSQLEERYSGVQKTQYGGPSQTEATWYFNRERRMLILWAPTGDAEQISAQLRQYPGCTKNLKID